MSTMQKIGLTNYSSFLVWKGVSSMDVITMGLKLPLLIWNSVDQSFLDFRGSQQPFLCVLGHFRHSDTQPNKQPTW